MSCNCKKHRERRALVSRRDILRFSIAGMTFATLGPWGRKAFAAPMAPGSQKILIIVNMFGGNDGLNTLIPDSLSAYFTRRPTLGILSTGPNASLSLAGGPGSSIYRLHPSLGSETDSILDLWNAGDVAFVNKIGYKTQNQSHFESEDIRSFGKEDTSIVSGSPPSGWIARYAEAHAPTPTGAISVGISKRKDFEGGSSNPLILSNLNNFQYQVDNVYQNTNDPYRKQTITDMIAAYAGSETSAKTALDQGLALESEMVAAKAQTTVGNYGSNSPGSYLRDIAKMIKQGLDTRVFYTGFGGFDTHGNQGAGTGNHANLMTRLKEGIRGLAADLKDMGIWNNVVIHVTSEFGRRMYENGSGGTDHGRAGAELFIGGAVTGGIFGPDITNGDINGETLGYEIDFRDPMKDVLGDHMALGSADIATIFPDAQEKTNTNLGFI